MALRKESFVAESIIQLIQCKIKELSSGWLAHGLYLGSIGDGLEFNMHRKTKWQSLKNLEKDGYVKLEGKTWNITDEFWTDIKRKILDNPLLLYKESLDDLSRTHYRPVNEEILRWIDQQIDNGRFQSRIQAVEFVLINWIRQFG